MTTEQMQAELSRLMAENTALKAKKLNKLGLKVAMKGGVSVYGLMRFPVTLRPDQWDRLLAFGPEIQAFAKTNADQIAANTLANAKDAVEGVVEGGAAAGAVN